MPVSNNYCADWRSTQLVGIASGDTSLTSLYHSDSIDSYLPEAALTSRQTSLASVVKLVVIDR